MAGPLTGLKIVEFAGLGPGPFCGMMLADHGAEIIRIDKMIPSTLVSDPAKEFMNRSRQSVSVNLKDKRGVKLVREICANADAVFEGFRPGVMERLGLGPDVLIGDNQKLVYGRMTGWGQDGPYAPTAGHDINYIAISGALHTFGRKGEKPVPPINMVGDFGGGGMMLAFSMVAALLSAQKTGQGQVIDCAMTEGSAVLMAMIYSMRSQGLWNDDRGVNALDSGSHYYDSYETSDGKYIALGAVEPQFYAQLIALIGLDDDPEFVHQNNPKYWPVLKEKMEVQIKTKTRDEWTEILEGTDACFAPILSLDEAPTHVHNVARKAFVEVDGILQPAPTPRYSGTQNDSPKPMKSGEKICDLVLGNAGLDSETIAQLRAEGVVA